MRVGKVVIFPKDAMPLMANPCGPEPWRLVTITFREEFGTENPQITSMTNGNTSLALAQQANGFEFYLGYTHLVFAKDDDSDDEWSAGLSYGELPYGLETALDATYSKDARAGVFRMVDRQGIQSERRVSAIRVGHVRME